MQSNKSKIALTLVAVAAVAGIVFGITQANESKPAPAPAPQQQQSPPAQTDTVEYKGSEGKNALELLKQYHKVETKSYEGLGELVTSIDGVAAASNQFWAFYVNGQQSQVGASAYITKDADTIVWKLEEIK